MKKIACWGMIIFLTLVIGMGMIPIPEISVGAAESVEEIIILDDDFASTQGKLNEYGILEKEVLDVTPVSPGGYSKLAGSSYSPELVGEENNKYINSSINVDNSVEGLNANNYDLNTMALELWMRLDLKPGQVTRGITIEISSADEANKISWSISAENFKKLVTRDELSDLDKKLFATDDVNVATIGWVRLTLPVSVASIQGSLVTVQKFNFEKLNIKQTSTIAGDVSIAFYDIKFVRENDPKDRITSTINDFCVVALKPSASVNGAEDEFYYGEIFPQFLASKSVYSCLYVGDEDYLDGTHSADLKIRVETGQMGASTSYYSYGSYNFKLESHEYNIAYGFLYDGKFVSVLADNVIVGDYGDGVWLEEIDTKFRVGDKKKISYTIHSAFKNATINFESTNRDVLEIIEVNKSSRYIIVECLKNGNAGINILIQDARLEGTEYEDSGINNDNFKIQVLKAEKNVDTTKVMLWIALGLLLAGLVYLAIKAIIDSKKIEIR